MHFEIKDGKVLLFDSYDFKDRIKQIFGRSWNPEIKAWTFPYRPDIVKQANEILNCSIPVPAEQIFTGHKITPFFLHLKHLYKHQKQSVSVGKNLKYMADLSEPGTGKTYTAIELMLQRDAFPTLVICPKSIMETVWYEEILRINELISVVNQMSPEILTGGSSKIKETLSSYYINVPERKVFIINYDIVSAVKASFEKIGLNQIILDESTRIKNPQANRSKAIIDLGKNIKYRHIMTGTVAPNSLLDAFNQMKFLSPDLFGQSYYAFRQHYFMQQPFDEYGWYAKPNTYARFKNIMTPYSIQHKLQDCADLPPLTFETRQYNFSDEQDYAYREMKQEALVEMKGMTVVAPFKITALMKLRQICSGFIYTEEEDIPLQNGKLTELNDLLDDYSPDTKIIIFAHFRKSMAHLSDALCNSVIYEGSDKKRKEVLNQFKEDKGVKYLIANPASTAHGLNLQYCSNIIYYELDYSLENYLQSMRRINRIGQKNKMKIVYLIGAKIEKSILAKLRAKESMNKKLTIDKIKEMF